MHETKAQRVLTTTLLLPAALVLAGCTLFSPQPSPSPITLNPLPEPSVTPAAEVTPHPCAPLPIEGKENYGPNPVRVGSDLRKPFGAYFQFPLRDGPWNYHKDVILTVDDAGPYTLQPGDSYGPKKASRYHRYKIRIENHSSSPQHPSLFPVQGVDGEQPVELFMDASWEEPVVGKQVGRAPQRVLLPGQTVEWFVAFPAEKDVQIIGVNAIIYDEGNPDCATRAVSAAYSNRDMG